MHVACGMWHVAKNVIHADFIISDSVITVMNKLHDSLIFMLLCPPVSIYPVLFRSHWTGIIWN